MIQQEHLTRQHIGLIASAVSRWHREQQKLIKEEVDRATPSLNEWIGSPKGSPSSYVGLTVCVR